MNQLLTRIAPTPSGYLHLGNAYSFLVTKAIAEKFGAKILLRIDDLDRDRFREEYVQDIFDCLDFLEINIDQGPRNLQDFHQEWSQIHRFGLYEQALEKLRVDKKVFACTCSRKKISQLDSSGYYLGHCLDRKIPLQRPEVAWRLDTLDADLIKLKDIHERMHFEVIPEDVAFFVVRKKDRLPSYQLTSLIDDIHFGVNVIVRGKDLYSSSIAQTYLAEQLNLAAFQESRFFHHELMKGPKKKKLSKTDGATSIKQLRKDGKSLNQVIEMIGDYLGKPFQNYDDIKKTIS